ncbi:MAG: nuclear transport factor 2 family protein [Rhodospirillales bacterium]
MSDIDPKAACVHAYVAAFDAGDAEAAAALFAADATLEDPYGSEVLRGTDAIRAFYVRAMASGARLALNGPPRVAGDAVAFAFTVTVAAVPGGLSIDVIDLFRFGADGRIASMQAFWGPANVRTG